MEESFEYSQSKAIADGFLLEFPFPDIPQFGNCMTCFGIGTYRFGCALHGSEITIFVPHKATNDYIFFHPTLVAAVVGKQGNEAYVSRSVPIVIPDDQIFTGYLNMPLFSENYDIAVNQHSDNIESAVRRVADGRWGHVDHEFPLFSGYFADAVKKHSGVNILRTLRHMSEGQWDHINNEMVNELKAVVALTT